MAGADLDDAAGLALAHEIIGDGGVQPRKPVLVPARQPRALRQMIEGRETPRHRGRRGGEAGLEGGISCRRRQLAGMAIGNEIAAGLQAEQRRQAQRQAPAIDAPGIRLAQGVSVMPSRATRLPGRALASASAWRSMNASLWLGSWWKATKVFTPAASASFSPCAQVEWPQPA